MIIICNFCKIVIYQLFTHKLLKLILKMKKITLLALGLILAFSCSKENPNEIVEPNSEISESQKLLSVPEVNSYIEGELKQNGDVNWMKAPSAVLWSAVVHGGEVLSVGFGEKDESFSIQRSPRLMKLGKMYIILYSLKKERVSLAL